MQCATFGFELSGCGSYCRTMKRFYLGLMALLLFSTPAARAQDAATEERLNKLAGRVEDLLAAQEAQRKQIAEWLGEVDSLREQQNKPGPAFASQDSVNRLADAVREVDQKRLEDYEKIRAELLKLGRVLSAGSTSSKSTPPPAPVE